MERKSRELGVNIDKYEPVTNMLELELSVLELSPIYSKKEMVEQCLQKSKQKDAPEFVSAYLTCLILIVSKIGLVSQPSPQRL